MSPLMTVAPLLASNDARSSELLEKSSKTVTLFPLFRRDSTKNDKSSC